MLIAIRATIWIPKTHASIRDAYRDFVPGAPSSTSAPYATSPDYIACETLAWTDTTGRSG